MKKPCAIMKIINKLFYHNVYKTYSTLPNLEILYLLNNGFLVSTL